MFLQALQDLGASVTEDWEHCTHLLASSIRTTDKFLCALGTGAFVLTPTWATDSIAAGELLPEGQYSLKDVDGEQKFGISLVRSRERALALQAPLFQGLKFFFLPSAVDKLAMYSGVIDFYRGQVCTVFAYHRYKLLIIRVQVQGRFKPASRQLGPGKGYMIGAVVDDGWQSLAEAHGIYSVDFITRSILQQQLDTTAFRLQSPEL
ncbi:hypothetical protein C8F04DRAFT_969898 [Mycena alexandri]|uniref:BRCT domain-containing protein n=1 Tax=Mycena alexandri TaxID=1745969 RepID=A0AAD6SA49_9AGAR|nr:hypothetical protein C8F04DRAFT_969898 [Mycena alexandri]